jgi:hypothetical protein
MDTTKPGSATAAAACLVAAFLALAGCASLSAHLPWRHRATPPPEVSTALTVTAADGTALSWPQVWQRNDVVLDLSAVTGAGSAVVMPRAGLAWPVRVALRVTAGNFGSIEVRGAQRLILPVPAKARGPVDLELPPGVYVAATRQITLTWGPANVPAE